MGAPKLLTACLAVTLLASCSKPAATPPEPDNTAKSPVSAEAISQTMPLAATPAGDDNPLRVLPLVDALNAAWQPLILKMRLSKPMPWGNAGIGLMAVDDRLDAFCRPHSATSFDITLAHGVYCLAPESPAGVVNPVYGTILFPDDHFKTEATVAPGDPKVGVALLIAYFYTLHVRQILDASDLLATAWPGTSQTQWCLTGVSLRALGALDASATTASMAAQEPLPLNLTYAFSGEDPDDRHAGWVMEGFTGGTTGGCFR